MTVLTVSLALATYNGAKYLPEQLASYVAQTPPPDERVVGDDGSSDATMAVLEGFARTAPFPVRITRNPVNYGYSRNFCETVQRCGGDVIFLSDQDDVWHPDKIARCLAVREADPACLLVTHDAQLTDAELNPGEATLGQQLAASGSSDPHALVNGCSMAIDRFLAGFVSPPPRDFHDMWLALIASLLDGRRHIAEPMMLYRRHGGNASYSHLTSLRRANTWGRLRNRVVTARRQPAAATIADAVVWHDDLTAAFERNEVEVTRRVGAARLAAILADLRRDRARLEERRLVHAGAAALRPLRIARLITAGGYRGAGGKLSALRDLLG